MRLLLAPRTLTQPTLILLAVAGILAAVTSDPSASLRDRMLWLGSAVVAQLALTVVYVVGARLGAARSRLSVLAVVVAGAAARGLVLAFVISAVGVTDPLPLGQRILSSTVTFTAWAMLFGAVVQGWQDYRAFLRALLRRVDHALEEASILSQEWDARLGRVGTSPAELARTADALHLDIADRLRPLSHRLWFGVTDAQSRRRFIASFLAEPWHVGWIALASLATYVWTTSYHFGLAYSLSAGVITETTVIAILLASNALARRAPDQVGLWRVGGLLITIAVPSVVDTLLFNARDPLGLLVVTVGLAGITIAVQVIAVSARQRSSSLMRLGNEVDALDAERDRIATTLHSTMQSQWTAAAMRLQEASETGDIESAARALADARAVVAQSAPTVGAPSDPSTIASAWAGIASVHLDIPSDVPDSARHTLSHLIEEAISNAVRHGRARSVDVLVTVSPSRVDVVVTDDGIGVDPHARPGFGSRWLDQVADWEITREATGSCLRASIPCVQG